MAAAGKRIHFLDNLRTAMVFLVVLIHSGIVYESSGFFAPFWLVDDPSTNDLAGCVNIFVDVMVMPTIFFVSGFFAPGSVSHRERWGFLTHRLKRLIVPWLIAVLTLMPLYKVIFLHSRQLPQEHWSTYFHFSNGVFSQSWLWFLPVLFLFDVAFWWLARAKVRVPDITLTTGVVAAFAIGLLYSAGMGFVGAGGWTKTALLDFQNERLLIYFMLFLLGALCFRLGALEALPASKKLYIAVSSTIWIPLNVYFFLVINFFLRPGVYYVSELGDALLLWLAFHVSMLGMLYVLVTTFRLYRKEQGSLGKVLNGNAYGVYIVHMVVVGGIALVMLSMEIPSLLKYLVLTLSSYVVSNLIVHGYHKVGQRCFAWRAGHS